ncbi:MAG: S-layer homology domain-containing protein, partial [Cyanobacteria bacterium J06648_11]
PIPTESQPPEPLAPAEPPEATSGEQTPPISESAVPESAVPESAVPESAVPGPVRQTPGASVASTRFRDLGEAPEAGEAIAALDALDVFDEVAGDRFAPNRSIRRGEFARWLVRANNALYADRPARQIRLGKPTDTPVFLDVPEDRPDFIYIQALARAGLAAGDRDGIFQPDLLLSRAELIRMKAAIDALPPARNEAEARDTVSQLWGFSDVNDIPANVLNSLIADASLGDDSNVSRTFGLTRAFDAQTPITRAEAAIALAAFGSSDDRRVATEASPTSGNSSSEPDRESEIDESSTPTAPPASAAEPDNFSEPQVDREESELESDRPTTQDSPSAAPSPSTGGFITDTTTPDATTPDTTTPDATTN